MIPPPQHMKIKGGLLEAGEGGKMRKTKSIIYRLIEQSKLLKVIFKKRENRKRMGQPVKEYLSAPIIISCLFGGSPG